MARRFRGLVLFGSALAVIGLVAQSACNAFSLPSRECLAAGMNQSLVAPGVEDPCQTCLQSRCCDVVGDCQRAPGCAQAVHDTHACLLDGGRPRVDEPTCTPLLRAAVAADAAVDTYACLGRECRAECGLPTCSFGPNSGVPTFLNASCDRCIESACCEPAVACAGDRRCKAALDCIASSCAGDVAAVIGGSESAAAQELERVACAGAGPLPTGASVRIACVARCLDLFAPVAPAGIATDEGAARCNATHVLTCGARAGCGTACATFFAAPDGG